MTVYYLVYDSLGLASERIGNFRSDNKTLNDNLANGVEYLVKRVPNELLDSSSACILEFTEVKPRVIQNTQATADVKAARVLEEFENGVLPSVQRVKLKAETHPTDRAIAEWIVGEKTKHASIVSRAYDTGEAGSLEKYTDEVQSIVRMTLDILEGGGPAKEYAVASAEEAIVKTAFDFLEEQLLNPENAAYSAEEIRDMLDRALPDSLWKSKRDIEYDPQGYPDVEDNVLVKPVVNNDMIVNLTRMMKTPKGRDAEVTFSGSILAWFQVLARCPFTDLRAPAGVDYTGRNIPSEASMKKAEDEVLERLDAMIDKLKR